MRNIKYSNDSDVMLGDHVETRDFFRKVTGRVVYVPGISPKHPDMEHHGLVYVGIQVPSGPLLATLVNPETFRLKKKVRLLERDSEPTVALDPNKPLENSESTKDEEVGR